MKYLSFLLLLSIAIFTPQIASVKPNENFGQPIEAYSIRPGLLLSVTRYPNGQPKRMIIESALADHDIESLALPGMLNQKMIDEVIEQLVPIELREVELKKPKAGICADSCSFTLENSEHVRITLISRISWHELDRPFGQFYKDRDEVQRLVIDWHQPHKSTSDE